MTDPKHVAIILDGNRRFAKRLMESPWKGHELGAKKVGRLLRWCADFGIKELTLYAFSIDNFNRPKKEFDFLMSLFMKAFEELKENKEIHENRLKIRFLGRMHMFPEKVSRAASELIEITKNYDDHTINFCMAYGGREEIADATKKIVADVTNGKIKPDQINDETIKNYLYNSHEPDMIIRTGGEKRLSGFLLYQCSYSELFFIEKMWPEFEKEDLKACIDEFKQRNRRFGR